MCGFSGTLNRGKTPGLDELDFDDLYNNLKVYEHELKGVSNSNSQNIAFLSAEVKGSTLKQSTAEPAHIPKGYTQAISSKAPTAPTGFLTQMKFIWIRKFMRKTGRSIDLKPKNGITFDKSKIECFNCQKLGHFARECRFAKYQENRANGRNEKRIVAIEDSNPKALVATDNNEDIDWTKEFDAETNGLDDFDCEQPKPDVAHQSWLECLSPTEEIFLIELGLDYSWISSCALESLEGLGLSLSNSMESEFHSGDETLLIYTAMSPLQGLDETRRIRNKVVNQEKTKSSHQQSDRNKGNKEEDLKVESIVWLQRNCRMSWTMAQEDMGHVKLQNINKLLKASGVQESAYDWFVDKKGIKRGIIALKDSTANGVAERKNTTLIEVARTIVSRTPFLLIQFWAEAVNTACYVLNRIWERKTMLIDSKEQGISCDDVEDLDDQQFIVHTAQPMHPEEYLLPKTLNDDTKDWFEEEKRRISIAKGKEQVDSTFTLSTANTPPQSGVADYNNMDPTIDVPSTPTLRIHKIHPQSQIIGKSKVGGFSNKKNSFIMKVGVEAMQEEYFNSSYKRYGMLCGLPEGHELKIQTLFGICISFMGFIVLSDGMSRLHFFYGTSMKEVYVKQAYKFEDPAHSNKVYDCVSLYLTAFMIQTFMFAVCLVCNGFHVHSKVSHLHAVKGFFRYLKHQPKLGLWYPKDSPFHLEAFSDSDYAGDNHDRRSTSGGCQYLGRRLVSWQCKKQTIVAISSTEAEYVAAASCCAQVLWMQNQLLDYGFNFMNTEIHIDNESTICIVKNPVFHSKTKHIQIRHHFIRDCYEQRLINVVKVHTDDNVADLLTKGFDLARFNFLVLGKKILISEATIRADLLFDDENGVDCFPKQVFWDLLRDIGYEVLSVPHGSNLAPTSLLPSRISNKSEVQLFFADNEWNARTYFKWGCSRLSTQSAAHSQRTASVQGTASFHGMLNSQGTAEIQGTADFQDSEANLSQAKHIIKLKRPKLKDNVQIRPASGQASVFEAYGSRRRLQHDPICDDNDVKDAVLLCLERKRMRLKEKLSLSREGDDDGRIAEHGMDVDDDERTTIKAKLKSKQVDSVRGGLLVKIKSIGQSTVYKWLEENIESVIGINKDDIDEEDDESSTMEPPSRNEAIKAAITLNNFLLSYEKTTPEVLTMLRKIRDEIQGEIDFNKKQKTIESFFKKPS
ncbi:putative ribonuclease H-like domain-containing protein [Tanacetum coccineum]